MKTGKILAVLLAAVLLSGCGTIAEGQGTSAATEPTQKNVQTETESSAGRKSSTGNTALQARNQKERTPEADPGTKQDLPGEKPIGEESATQRQEERTEQPASKKQQTEAPKTEAAKTDTHTHHWIAVTERVHHPAVTEQVWITDRDAWDEPVTKTEPVYEDVLICVASCRACGAMFASEDVDTALFSCQDHILSVHDNSCGYGTEQSYHEQRQTGTTVTYETIHHPAEGHYETKVKQEAYDETVITGYRCEGCGAVK